MNDTHCNFCKEPIEDSDNVYGLTSGLVDAACFGFLPDPDEEWIIICPECMNKIDKFMANLKRTDAP